MGKIKHTKNISKNNENKDFARSKNAIKRTEIEKFREPSESTDCAKSEERLPSDCTGTVKSISSSYRLAPQLGSRREKVTPCAGSTFTTRPNSWEIVAEIAQNPKTDDTQVGSSKNKEFVTYL